MSQKITSCVYALQFRRSDASKKVLNQLEQVRQHSTGRLPPDKVKTLVFYIGMSERISYVDGKPFPLERQQEHEREPYQKSTAHLHSKQAIKILDDNNIPWTCRVLRTYTKSQTKIDEEMMRLKYVAAHHPIMNTVSGLSALPDGSLDELSKITDPDKYKRRKKQLKEKPINPNDPRRIYWPDTIQFTDDEKQFLVTEVIKFVKDKFSDHKPLSYQSWCNPKIVAEYLFNGRGMPIHTITSKELKSVVKRIIQDGQYKPESKPSNSTMPDPNDIEAMIEWHMSRTDDDWETGAAMINRMSGR